jgi:hypothetical protein
VVALDVPFSVTVTPATGPFSSVTEPRTGKSAATAARFKNNTRPKIDNLAIKQQFLITIDWFNKKTLFQVRTTTPLLLFK